MLEKGLVYQAVEKKIEGTGFFIVDVKISTDNQVLVEIDCNEGVDIDSCVEISRYLETVFDREVEDYALEVGSAGITQPFKVLKQYLKNIGNEVEVLTKSGKKLEGILTEATPEKFTLTVEKKVKQEGAKRKIKVLEPLTFAYEEVKYTKYIIRFK
jgi:ribosome maturation factor RimP